MDLPSLKLTAKAPENGWLEYFLVSFWEFVYFQGLKPVSFRECLACFHPGGNSKLIQIYAKFGGISLMMHGFGLVI